MSGGIRETGRRGAQENGDNRDSGEPRATFERRDRDIESKYHSMRLFVVCNFINSRDNSIFTDRQRAAVGRTGNRRKRGSVYRERVGDSGRDADEVQGGEQRDSWTSSEVVLGVLEGSGLTEMIRNLSLKH